MDYVPYSADIPWPFISESGQYIQLISVSLDNHFGEAWKLMPDPDDIPNEQSAEITMYPNPANSYVFLNSDEVISNVKLFDMTGRMVHQIQANSNQITLHTDHLNRGVYNLLINSSIHRKLCIEK
jgi:hypothetical protein